MLWLKSVKPQPKIIKRQRCFSENDSCTLQSGVVTHNSSNQGGHTLKALNIAKTQLCDVDPRVLHGNHIVKLHDQYNFSLLLKGVIYMVWINMLI